MSTTQTPLLSPEFLARLETLELVSRKVLRGRLKGERRSKRKGQSVEFADYRNYVVGDDLRFIDWNLYARLDRLFLKLHVEEEDLHFYVLMDDSFSMDFGDPAKLYYAKQIAAALGFIGLVHSDRVVIETIHQPAKQAGTVLRGRANLWRMLDALQQIPPVRGSTDLAAGVKNFALRHGGKGIVVLISDFLDKNGYEAALRFLIGQQMDVYVIHVLAPEELEPDLTGDLRLVDCEDGDVAEVSVNPFLLKKYQETLQAFIGGIRTFCNRRGITYLLGNSGHSVETLITNYLRKRGLVR